MITEAVDTVTDQFDKVGGIIDNMETVRHLSDVINGKIEKILLSERRRRDEPGGSVAVSFTLREIELLLWATSKAVTAADTLSAELDVARSRLLDAFNQDTRDAA
ncbi:hypothetical protein [Pelagibacterium lacus]|uniref:Uncharacterized protein n=1 Tax=Pelagibacterium lacus TaxID=2282655 RepID=A0A369W2V9_9HYPH|nr:hypothetical protein [Pelagibacterium lacus]RDE08379.1 hypothetical protein DVH29_11655 [Pelagibacterium lacus]